MFGPLLQTLAAEVGTSVLFCCIGGRPGFFRQPMDKYDKQILEQLHVPTIERVAWFDFWAGPWSQDRGVCNQTKKCLWFATRTTADFTYDIEQLLSVPNVKRLYLFGDVPRLPSGVMQSGAKSYISKQYNREGGFGFLKTIKETSAFRDARLEVEGILHDLASSSATSFAGKVKFVEVASSHFELPLQPNGATGHYIQPIANPQLFWVYKDPDHLTDYGSFRMEALLRGELFSKDFCNDMLCTCDKVPV
jgi:hypothetical protein